MAPGGRGRPGVVAPPLGIEYDNFMLFPCKNTLEFSLVPSPLASNTCTLKFSLKRRKITKIFISAFGEPKRWPFSPVRAVLPSGKFLAGAQGTDTGEARLLTVRQDYMKL